MAEHSLIIPETERVPAVQGPGYSPTLRDIVAIGFRRRRLIALSFFGIMMGAGMAALFLEAYFVVNGYFALLLPDVNPINADRDAGSRDAARIAIAPIHAFLTAQNQVVVLLIEDGVSGSGSHLLVVEVPGDVSGDPQHSISVILGHIRPAWEWVRIRAILLLPAASKPIMNGAIVNLAGTLTFKDVQLAFFAVSTRDSLGGHHPESWPGAGNRVPLHSSFKVSVSPSAVVGCILRSRGNAGIGGRLPTGPSQSYSRTAHGDVGIGCGILPKHARVVPGIVTVAVGTEIEAGEIIGEGQIIT